MIDINRQKFLNELARLLTFMYEEDRQTALELYNDMFDDAEDEQALIHYLISPTRQAVLLARVYDTKERKLQVQSRDEEDSGAAPSFIGALLEIRDGAPLRHDHYDDDLPPVRQEEKGQLSLFGEDSSDEIADAPISRAAEVKAAPAADTREKAVDDFMAGFSIPAPEAEPGTEAIVSGGAGTDMQETEVKRVLPDDAPVSAYDNLAGFPDEDMSPTKREPRVGLLILYILLAIPVGLLGIMVLLIPTLACLSCAVSVVTLGVFAVTAAFAGFSVFADVLLVLGIAIIVLAFGLLFAWLFIWFIIGPMVSLVKGIVSLGNEWCYKEVKVS